MQSLLTIQVMQPLTQKHRRYQKVAIIFHMLFMEMKTKRSIFKYTQTQTPYFFLYTLESIYNIVQRVFPTHHKIPSVNVFIFLSEMELHVKFKQILSP